MTRLLTFFFCVVLSVLSSAAKLTPDTTALCTKPVKIGASSFTDGKSAVVYAATTSTSPAGSSITYEIQYKLGTDSTWQSGGLFGSISPNSNLDTLVKLIPCSRYVYRVRTVCSATQSSDWVNGDFQTAGCPPPCTKVQDIGFAAIDSVSAAGKWSTGGSGKYYIQYKVTADSVKTWSYDSTTQTNYTVKNLKKCTPYVVLVITNCNGKFDTIETHFQTLCSVVGPPPCVAPGKPKVAVTADTTANFTWTRPVGALAGTSFNYVLVVSSISGDFKKYYTVADTFTTVTDLPKCNKYSVIVVTKCDSTHYSRSTDTVQFTLACPPKPCTKVLQLGFYAGTSNTAPDSAIGYWSAGGSGEYYVQYKIAADSVTTWSNDSTSHTNITLRNLVKCSPYIARIITYCNGKPDTSVIARFQTGGCTIPCNKVVDISFSAIDSVSATGKWSTGGSGKYYVQYKVAVDSIKTWSNDSTIQTNFALKNLKKCTPYIVRIITNCGTRQDTIVTRFETKCPIVTTPCNAPLHLQATNSNSVVSFSWGSTNTPPSGGGSGKYSLVVASATGDFKKSYTVSDTSFKLTDLPTCQLFNAAVISLCDSTHYSSPSNYVQFSTAGCLVPCNKVDKIGFNALDSTSALGQWNTAGSGKYYIQYKAATDSVTTWFNDSTTSPSITLKGLKNCQYYIVRVITFCNNKPDTSAPIKFQTKCPSTPLVCPKVNELSFVGVDTSSAAGQWSNTGSSKYYVEYKIAVDSIKTWSRDSSTLTGIKLKNLKPCTIYSVRILSVCNGRIDTGAVSKFQTTCPITPFICNAPKNLTDTIVSDTVVILNWNASNANSIYVVTIYSTGTTAKKLYIATTNSLTIKDLPKCFSYYATVQLRCDSAHTTEASNPVQFSIKGCVTPPPTCNKIGLISVSDVSTSSLNVSWNKSGSGKYVVQHKIAADSVKVWLNDSVSNESFTIKGLASCSAYSMRVIANCNGKLDTSSSIKITTLCPKPVCLQPYSIREKSTSDTTVNVSWTTGGSKNFVLQYRESTSATTSWISTTLTDSFVNLTLKSCAYFQLRLRSLCDSLNPNWLYYEFKTTGTCAPTVCTKPSNIQSHYVDSSKTYIFWNYFTVTNGATQPVFEIQYKATTDTVWSPTIKSNSVYTILSGLVNCKQFTVRVRAACASTSSSDWVSYTFNAGLRCNIANPNPIKAAALSNVGVSPNPSATEPTVSFDLSHSANVTIKVFNLIGSGLININLGSLPAGTYFQTVNNASLLNTGFYIISTQADGETPVNTRWMKL